MGKRLTEEENIRAFEHAKAVVDAMVKSGSATPERAKKILDEARVNYRNHAYNRAMDMLENKR